MSEPSSTAPASGPPEAPPRIPDHELLRRIGEGSYGEVWLARCALGTYRAVKIIHVARFKDDDRPYEREFTGLKNFEPISRGHEGLVDILQVGRNDAAGYFYYVMELADDANAGPDQRSDGVREKRSDAPPSAPHDSTTPPLHRPSPCVVKLPATGNWQSYQPLTLESRIRAEGRLPVPDCVRIAATLADALRYLHEHDRVHRDIKPSNIIFVDGVPKLADIGLVAHAKGARSFVGTEGFIAPEGPGTPKADIYGLGKVLYEMAMGKDRRAFPSPPTQLDELPDRQPLLELNEVINKACDPDPAERHQNASAMLAELQLLQRGDSVSRARVRRKRLRWAARLAIPAALLLAIGGVASYLGSHPRLEAVRTLEMPADWTGQRPLVGDWNADGQPDVYLVGGRRVWVVSATGKFLRNVQLATAPVLGGSLIADVNGDKSSELFLSWPDGTKLHIGVFNHAFAEFKRFTAHGALPQDAGPNYSSALWTTAFADLRNDGHPALIALLMTGHGKQPREVQCYDYGSGDLRWRYPVAAFVSKVATVDLDDDGVLDLLCESAAVGNGSRLDDGTDDEHCYLYAISGDGRKLWTRQLGDTFAHCEPVVTITEEPRTKAIFAFVSRGYVRTGNVTWPEVGEIVRLDGEGNELARYNAGTALKGMLVAKLKADGKPRLLATDARGFLHVLDLDLNLLNKRQIVPCLHDWVNLTLTAVADLDGDGHQELLFTCQQIRMLAKESMLGLTGPPHPKHALDNCVLVFNADLRPLAKHVLDEKWEHEHTVHSAVLDVPGQRHKAIVALANRVYFLHYSRR